MSSEERATLLALQQALTEEQFQSLKFLLEERLPLAELLPASRPVLCRLLLQRFPGRALSVTAELLRQIARHDLLRQFGLPGAEEEEVEEKTLLEKEATSSSRSSAAPVGHGEKVPRSGAPRRLTEKELMEVAQKLGKEWQEVGIACLGLERSHLEQIQEDNPRNVVLQSFQMLREWRRRQQGEATASRLLQSLASASLDPELLDLLQSFQER